MADPTRNGNGNGKDTSVDWPPLFEGPAKGVYKHQVLAKSQSRTSERLLEIALLDCCGGKADTWIGNDKLAARAHVAIRSVRWLLTRLESRGKWKSVDDSRLRSRRRIIDLSHPHAEAVLEALRQSPHVTFERSRSNPEAIARTKKSAGLPFSDNSHVRGQSCAPRGGKVCPPEGARFAPKPLTVNRSEEPLMNGNSRGGTGGEKNLSNGNGKPLAPLATGIPLGEKDLPTDGGKAFGPCACPGCGKPMEVAGKTRSNPAGTHLACFRCGIQKTHAQMAALSAEASREAAAEDPSGLSGLEYLKRLRRGASTADCNLAVAVLCKTFEPTDAVDCSKAYRQTINRVRRGFLAPAVIVHAFQQAMLPSADNPGRVFAFNISHRITKNGDGQVTLAASKAH